MNLIRLEKLLLILIFPLILTLIFFAFSSLSDLFYAKEFDKYSIRQEIPRADDIHSSVMDFLEGKSFSLPD